LIRHHGGLPRPSDECGDLWPAAGRVLRRCFDRRRDLVRPAGRRQHRHPAFILLGSYVAFIGNTVFGIDPILAAAIMLPAFYLLGMVLYQVYYVAFERRDDQSLRGLSFSSACCSSPKSRSC